MKTWRDTSGRKRANRRGKQVISRLPLHEQVAEEIRDQIIAGDLQGGEKIRISELAGSLNVSMTPMREALKVLAKENLVELTANRGARVSEITVEGTRSVFEVMSRIEALAAELAAVRITDTELAQMEERHARMRAHHEAEELNDYFELNHEIHERVASAARNPDLLRLRTSLAFQVERARFLAVGALKHRGVSMEDHENLMRALRDRDARAAHDIWKLHLERAGQETCRLVAEWKAGVEG